ncbi:hypothetical protein [Kribbella antiqua]|uniref:hypothetical protein n=1 Tax=Kribbella antiqua TaxID=2512217 RepID=UPI00130532EC|nr:hypothetical protein [Kribbella antiqua]
MEFRPDGTLVEWALGRADVPEARPAGRWEPNGLITRSSGGSARIIKAEPDRLEIIWQD